MLLTFSPSLKIYLLNFFKKGGEWGRAEFHQFLVIDKGSCAEVLSQLYVAYDVKYIDEQPFQQLKDMTVELGRIIGGLRRVVKQQK